MRVSIPRPASRDPSRRVVAVALAVLAWLAMTASTPAAVHAQQATCGTTVTANVVALDQTIFYNRLGAYDPAAMMFALERDIVPIDSSQGIAPGNVMLRPDLRPRPIVLRVNEGDCLQINFTNLLAPDRDNAAHHDSLDEEPATRAASVHVVGMQLVNSIDDDGSFVGKNPSSLVDPGQSATYTYYAQGEGGHMLYSAGATTGGEGDGGSLARGLFGTVTVEPPGAEYYRSQLTHAEMVMATVGTTPAGQPILDYEAVYPAGHKFAGEPIIKMTQGGEIVHTDINAIITGPGRGFFPAGTFPKDTILRNRNEPFREFTVIFHDEIGITQAFKIFEDPQMKFTLKSGRDAFAINYGTSGIGAEILANRFRVGPMWACSECKYEEFFLSGWAIGDPAQVVDIPANADLDGDGQPDPGPKANKVLFPADPSNVHHSYIGDHVKFRNLHMGPKEHHIFHLHAHQWVTSPNSDESTYLDSQAIGPGSSYTYEITYNGSGNRPKTPGDAIFHCHFYPHFAQGMWELWRNHDVFEPGTVLDADGIPVPGARALPDGEIAAGTPIPALVPIPGKPLPIMPTDSFPGYPFYIPGIGGHRPPHPPLDTKFDGGLNRHVVESGTAQFPAVNPLNFRKTNITMVADSLPETGTFLEREAMNFHATRNHPTYIEPLNPGDPLLQGDFISNGLPPKPGAPFADPCEDDFGNATGDSIDYKAADIQIDAKFNKKGWHYPQTRMLSLWGDVAAFENGTKPPEPLFFRANTNHCITYEHTNLVPNEYDLDDFQVLTPTDVIGQHIHLVKFDVTSSDGAANGYNYEDGAFSPEEVLERIAAIRNTNACTTNDPRDGTFECPVAKQHPYFTGAEGLGATIEIQRWFADDVLDNNGHDRTLRTVFTHDHFSPSTHQQAGLYAGLVVEPEGSQWFQNETGVQMGTRFDGGPTSWEAVIEPPSADSSFREFNYELADYALAYRKNNNGFPDPANVINPPGRMEDSLPFLLAPPNPCPNGNAPPCPEVISSDDVGTMVVNYRNEPLALRLRNPSTNQQADELNEAGDPTYAFSTNVLREDPDMNVQPDFYPPLTSDLQPRDPFTPMARAFEGDHIQWRILMGAHEEGHNFSVHGQRWLFEPSWHNSGYRNNEMMGISEHFEFNVPHIPALAKKKQADFLYEAGSSTDDLWNGLWGLMRIYKNNAKDLVLLPSNPDGQADFGNKNAFAGVCPKTAPVRSFDVTGVLAKDAIPGGALVYNSRTNQGGALKDPSAILYVRSSDLDANGQLKSTAPVEPLILRAAAGDCIKLTLHNDLPSFGTPLPNPDGYQTFPMIVNDFNANQIQPSRRLGLHPQLVSFDINGDDGSVVGLNDPSVAEPGKTITYTWYAGILQQQPNGNLQGVPVEFGGTNLLSSDRLKHWSKGAGGALIIEPQGSTWQTDPGTYAQATVTKTDGSSFRDFVLLRQNDINMRRGPGLGSPVPNTAEAEDPEDSGQKGMNFRTEPMWKRMGYEPNTPLTQTKNLDFSDVLSNGKVGGDPVTPVFVAHVGDAVRFHILQPGGNQRNGAIQVHGHTFQQVPYINNSTEIGNNPLSEYKGVREGMGPANHFEYVLANGAGGLFGISGDYLVRDQQSFDFDGGIWGILRVLP